MGRVADWLKGGDPDGPAKVKAWLTGNDGRPEGYTYSVSILVTGLMVVAIVVYQVTNGYGSIVALVVALLAMVGRHLLEAQSRRDFAALHEAQSQFGRTRNQDYVRYIRLRGESMLRDNRALRPQSRAQIHGLLEWAEQREKKARGA